MKIYLLRASFLNRELIIAGDWQPDFQYLACEDYDGTNTPEHSNDLRSFFTGVKEPTTYGSFSLASDDMPFNGRHFVLNLR